MAGCILIDFEKMQVINRSPAYRNQYVHRRDSVSLAMLSEAEIKERIAIGLIEGHTGEEVEEEDEEFEEEEWEEFDEDDLNTSREEMDSSADEEYVFDERRKSSVEPSRTTTSPPGSTHDNHDFDMESSGLKGKKIDFSGGESAGRRKKRDKNGRFDSIAEEEEDEDSTVNGDDSQDGQIFDDEENYQPGSSTSLSPAVKRFGIWGKTEWKCGGSPWWCLLFPRLFYVLTANWVNQ